MAKRSKSTGKVKKKDRVAKSKVNINARVKSKGSKKVKHLVKHSDRYKG